jgi:glycosyltransferase involved in cell wall biosynthesis
MTKTKDPLVSICCITYNHENYIRDAIEGFLMQKTDFPFEIIIHDDASTDATADIIREYERKHPDVIKPIYQTENQYSKGKHAILFTFMAARGKYLALCEGDDYWIDPLKLQKQITEMEKHPECYISFHPAIQRWVDGSRDDKMLGFYSDKNTIVPVEEVLLTFDIFMPTASIVLNRSVVSRIVSFFDLAKDAPVGDYYIRVLGAENGGALYLSDIMSVYRYGTPGSFTERRSKENSDEIGSWYRSCILSQDKLNTFTNVKYAKLFDIRRRRYYSIVIKSLHIDINTKKCIIDADSGNIGMMNHFLWNLVFKHPSIVNVLRNVQQLVKHVISHRDRQLPRSQDSLEKNPGRDTLKN